MSDRIWSIFLSYVLIGLYIGFTVTNAPLERSVPTLVMLAISYMSTNMNTIKSKLSDMNSSLLCKYRETHDSSWKYFARLLQFLRASDMLKEMYYDGLLYDPDYKSEDGSLTINLPNGMSLIVKDKNYPVETPGVYINLRYPCGSESCVARTEFVSAADSDNMRIIAYQYGKDEAAFDAMYMPQETE
jgi:hypothetical protein